jgi:hypothetical protein
LITRASVLRLLGEIIAGRAAADYVVYRVASLGGRLLAAVRSSGRSGTRSAAGPGRARVAGEFSAIALLLCGVSVLGASPARAAAAARSLEMTAVFAQPSYSPGQVARVRVVADATRLTVQPIAAFSTSSDPHAPIGGDPAVGRVRTIAWHPGAGMLTIRIGRLASPVFRS